MSCSPATIPATDARSRCASRIRRKSPSRETFAPLSLETLIELEIASGISAPHRLRDLADVIELIRVNELPADYRERLHPYVRDRFAELWQAAQVSDAE